MNWKKFLEPDRRKIVITLTLTFFIILVYSSGNTGGPKNTLNIPESCCRYIIRANQTIELEEPCKIFNATYCVQFLDNIKKQEETEEIKTFTTLFIESLLISYLMSCLIVWIYDKYFKNVNKK
jgi:hypothetical protein